MLCCPCASCLSLNQPAGKKSRVSLLAFSHESLDVATCTCSHARCYAIVFRCCARTHSRCYASVFHSWGGGGVRACVALAQMLDVTPLGSAVALAHMLNATPICVSLLGAVGGCKSVHCTCPHARCYAINLLHSHTCSMLRHCVPLLHSHTWSMLRHCVPLFTNFDEGPYFLAILTILLMQSKTCFP